MVLSISHLYNQHPRPPSCFLLWTQTWPREAPANPTQQPANRIKYCSDIGLCSRIVTVHSKSPENRLFHMIWFTFICNYSKAQIPGGWKTVIVAPTGSPWGNLVKPQLLSRIGGIFHAMFDNPKRGTNVVALDGLQTKISPDVSQLILSSTVLGETLRQPILGPSTFSNTRFMSTIPNSWSSQVKSETPCPFPHVQMIQVKTSVFFMGLKKRDGLGEEWFEGSETTMTTFCWIACYHYHLVNVWIFNVPFSSHQNKSKNRRLDVHPLNFIAKIKKVLTHAHFIVQNNQAFTKIRSIISSSESAHGLFATGWLQLMP